MSFLRVAIIALLLVHVSSRHTRAEGGRDSALTSSGTGAIKGVVLDAATQAGIPGASVSIDGTITGAAGDDEGRFGIAHVPAGGYTISARSIGYEPQSQTDVIVRPGRITQLTIRLSSRSVPIGPQSVTAPTRYFADPPSQPSSYIRLSSEEVRRSPGSGGWDVSRVFGVMPGLAKVNDQSNGLAVRGGLPLENAFYLDDIEIPNINHFPAPGSSGGPIGLLNVDFIEEASFSAGGFPATYGDRLSSVVELKFREGNRDEFDGQLDLNFAGFGGSAEGPLGGRGSWLLSARRSYLDLIVDAIGMGIAPRYSDYQGKVVYDVSPQSTVTLLGLVGVDFVDFTKEQSIEDGNIACGIWDGYEYAFGSRLRHLWGRRGYSTASLSYMATRFRGEFFENKSDLLMSREDDLEGSVHGRNVNALRFGETGQIEFGGEFRYHLNDYDHLIGEYTNPFGDTIPELLVRRTVESPAVGVFASVAIDPLPDLTTTLGMRYDYLDYNRHGYPSPRASFSYRLSDRTTVHGAGGIYRQTVPLALQVQRPGNRDLADPLAYQGILGLGHLLAENTRLTIEGYYKDYSNLPIDPTQPGNFAIDDIVTIGYFPAYESLVDEGQARAYGVEATLQKKMKSGFYGVATASVSKAQYEALDGIWRDRVLDNRLTIGLEGGWRPNRRWEFSLRWLYAGGRPYTPLDTAASRIINRSVYDHSRINAERTPAYHVLDLRIDRRFNFRRSSIVAYFAAWNSYNRRNVALYYWNEDSQAPDALYQFSLVPVIGVEYEF